MDKKVFYDSLRKSLFKGGLSQPNVEGFEALFKAANKYKLTSKEHFAFVLANVYHETGGYIYPIKETVFPNHKDKNPSDATVIKRLNNAFARGQLKWVRTPYWRSGAFGRGMVQITHHDNYVKFEKILGVPLSKDYNLSLNPDISAEIAVYGMINGTFTGKKLSDYRFPQSLSNKPSDHPRRIINGVDGTDRDINKYYRLFLDALEKANYSLVSEVPLKPTEKPVQEVSEETGVTVPETKEPSGKPSMTLVELVVFLIKKLFGVK